jgi:hypothetical protein
VRLYGSIGPAFFYVHEDADVRFFARDSVEGGEVLHLAGTRRENLDRVNFGGICDVGVSYRFASRVEVGLQLDSYLMAWNARMDKSLTSDFTKYRIGGMDVALVLKYPAP